MLTAGADFVVLGFADMLILLCSGLFLSCTPYSAPGLCHIHTPLPSL